MPRGTKVDKLYESLRRKGYKAGKPARIAQAATGTALETGKPPKTNDRRVGLINRS